MKRSQRSIVVNQKKYKYKIGQSFMRLTFPSGKSKAYPLTEVTGLSWYEIEKGHWKGWLKITPSEIKQFIEEIGE